MMVCPFCDNEPGYLSSELAYARFDKYPVSKGHSLVMPRRHISSYFGVTSEERLALWELVSEVQKYLGANFHPDGYNLGVNIGEHAGQTVMHAHIHVIPRYAGDVPKPRGGVHVVIPNKQDY